MGGFFVKKKKKKVLAAVWSRETTEKKREKIMALRTGVRGSNGRDGTEKSELYLRARFNSPCST